MNRNREIYVCELYDRTMYALKRNDPIYKHKNLVKIILKEFKGKRDNFYEAVDIKIGAFFYWVLYNIRNKTLKTWIDDTGAHCSDVEVDILEIHKCMVKGDDQYRVIYEIDKFIFDELEEKVKIEALDEISFI